MTTFLVNGLQLDPSNLWYHYNEKLDSENSFEVVITKDESELIQLIEDYSKCNLDFAGIGSVIIGLDSFKRSYGLMWHVLNYFKQKKGDLNTYDWEWVINNITEIVVESNKVILRGEVAKYK